MCQRKIVGKGYFSIVPAMNGCECPMIVQIRDLHTGMLSKHFLKRCIDIKNEFSVDWRFCVCGSFPCAVLPSLGPISDVAYNAAPTNFLDIEDFDHPDEEDFSLGGV